MHSVTAAPSANVAPEDYKQAVPVYSNAARPKVTQGDVYGLSDDPVPTYWLIKDVKKCPHHWSPQPSPASAACEAEVSVMASAGTLPLIGRTRISPLSRRRRET